MSSGNSEVNSILVLIIGWINDVLWAWRACLEIKEDSLPYKVSPMIGWPICFECNLIWWVLPVSKTNFTRDILLLVSKFITS